MAEIVNTTAVAVPMVDILYFETDGGKTHLVNAIDAFKNRPYPSAEVEGETYTVPSMCGRASVEVPHGESPKEAEALTHISERITPAEFNADPSLMNDPWTMLENVCQSCQSSWERAFREGDYQTFRFEL